RRLELACENGLEVAAHGRHSSVSGPRATRTPLSSRGGKPSSANPRLRSRSSPLPELVAAVPKVLRDAAPWVGAPASAGPGQACRYIYPPDILAGHPQRGPVERALRMQQHAPRERRVVRIAPGAVPFEPLLLRPRVPLVDDDHVGGRGGKVAPGSVGARVGD